MLMLMVITYELVEVMSDNNEYGTHDGYGVIW